MGTATIVIIIGGTAYAIKKSKDQVKQQDETISAEQARKEYEEATKEHPSEKFEKDMEDINEAAEEKVVGDHIDYEMDIDEIKEDIHDEINFNRSFDPPEEQAAALEDDLPSYTYDEAACNVPFIEIMTEEDMVLRHDPNSAEARNQYIRMELAEWRYDEETYICLLDLFQFPFIPQNDGDEDTRNQLLDHRAQFFGHNSKWSNEVSYADLILHYGRKLTFELDEDVRFWVDELVAYTEFCGGMPSRFADDCIKELNAHTYHNEELDTYGLFGLSSEEMDGAITQARSHVDKEVTYEIEYNEFLKSCLRHSR